MNQEHALYVVGFKKAEEPEVKLPPFFGLWRKQGSSRKKSTFASLTMLKALTVWISTNWKILKEMRVRDHLACLLRNLYTGQKANGELDLEPPTGSKQKGVRHGCVASPAYLTLCRARHVRCGPGWMASWIKISWRNINSLTHAEDTTLKQKCKRN